nr:ROK family protein [uncultured Methanoregula sp.]
MTADDDKPVTTVSIITRRLREGKTYEDFRKAWFHTTGFGIAGKDGKTGSNRMYSMINLFDPREVIVIGFATATPGQMEEALKIEVKFRGENPMDAVIEPEIGRKFAALVSEDDFSAAGQIPYKPPSVGGRETDMADFAQALQVVAKIFANASEKRDAVNEARKNVK